jgi:hypothetical protein
MRLMTDFLSTVSRAVLSLQERFCLVCASEVVFLLRAQAANFEPVAAPDAPDDATGWLARRFAAPALNRAGGRSAIDPLTFCRLCREQFFLYKSDSVSFVRAKLSFSCLLACFVHEQPWSCRALSQAHGRELSTSSPHLMCCCRLCREQFFLYKSDSVSFVRAKLSFSCARKLLLSQKVSGSIAECNTKTKFRARRGA